MWAASPLLVGVSPRAHLKRSHAQEAPCRPLKRSTNPANFDQWTWNGERQTCPERIALNDRARPKTSLVIEEKPICANAIALCLRNDCAIDEVCVERSLAGGHVGKVKGRLVVALVDLATINYDFDALRAFVARVDPCPVIAVDDRPNPAFSLIAEALDCRGYIAKTFEGARFAQAIGSVISGQSWFHLENGGHSKETDRRGPKVGALLTQRQSDVLACIARGSSNEEIASQLGISVGTVKTHVHTVLRRIGARNRTEAAIVAPRFYAHGGGRRSS